MKIDLTLLPSVIVIGEQRSGTSSLFKFLTLYSSFTLPLIKETHFFSRNYSNGFDWYNKCYPKISGTNNSLRLEICPSYLTSVSAFSRFVFLRDNFNYNPTFIIITREDSARINSLLAYRFRRKQIKKPILDSLVLSDFAHEVSSKQCIHMWRREFSEVHIFMMEDILNNGISALFCDLFLLPHTFCQTDLFLSSFSKINASSKSYFGLIPRSIFSFIFGNYPRLAILFRKFLKHND